MYSEIDARLQHPFTCLVSGPSQAGKSTLVSDIIRKQHRLINVPFEYVTIFLGTPVESNGVYLKLHQDLPHLVKLVDVNAKYPTKEDIKDRFSEDIKKHIKSYNGKPGCLIFDDLMKELGSSGSILLELFTKLCSHHNLSSIHITQNLFAKGAGCSDHTTLYRNSMYIILFESRLDNTVISHIARRIAAGGTSSSLQQMLDYIVKKHRYVLISGSLNTPKEIQFRTDITADEPYVYQRVFQLI